MRRLSSLTSLAAAACVLAQGLVLGAARADDSLPERARTAALQRGGAGPALFTRVGKLKAGASDQAQVELSPGVCVVASLALSRGEAELELLGKETALSDADLGEVARLRYCAGGEQEKLKLKVTSDERARFALGVFAVGEPPPVASEPVPAAESPPAPPPPLVEQLASLALGALPGYAAMAPPRDEDLDASDPRRREVVLEAGHCYRVLAAGELAVGAIALSLEGSRDGKLAVELPALAAPDPGSRVARSELVCAERTGPHGLEVRILGSGVLVWQLFGASDPDSAWHWAPGGDGQDLLARQVRSQRDQRAAGQPGVTPFVRRALQTAQHVDVSFEVLAGQCYLAIGAGVPSLRALELELSDQRGSPVERVSTTGEPAVARACAVVNGRWRVRLRAYKGYGDAGLQVFGGS